MRARAAPSFSIAAIVACRIPDSAPFQPTCAAPITCASASASSTGPQSAVVIATASPRTRVTTASARGAFSRVQGSSATTTWGECT